MGATLWGFGLTLAPGGLRTVVTVSRILAFVVACVSVPCEGGAQSQAALEGIIVREIRVTGLSKLSPGDVERHLATRVGAPFHQATLLLDRRRLDELRLFTAVTLQPRLDKEGVILEVTVSETLRVLPVVVIRVTDENGVSAGPGVRAINLFGHRAQLGAAVRFGGETAVTASVDSTTITPGARAWHVGFSDSSRRNELYDFDERATTVDARLSRNWRHGLRTGGAAEVMALGTGTSGASLSPDGTDVIATVGGFVTLDTLDSSTDPRAGTWAEFQIDRLFGDASSWTFTIDGRRFQRLSARHGFGLFSLASLQTGTVGETLPEYLQYALGGGNSVRGWDLGARRGRNQFIGTFDTPGSPGRSARSLSPASICTPGCKSSASPTSASRGMARTTSGPRPRSTVTASGCVCLCRSSTSSGSTSRGANRTRHAYFGVSLKAARQRQRVR